MKNWYETWSRKKRRNRQELSAENNKPWMTLRNQAEAGWATFGRNKPHDLQRTGDSLHLDLITTGIADHPLYCM